MSLESSTSFSDDVRRYNDLVDAVEEIDGIGPDRFRGRTRRFMIAREVARAWLDGARDGMIDAAWAHDLPCHAGRSGEPWWEVRRPRFERCFDRAEVALRKCQTEHDRPRGKRCRRGDTFDLSELQPRDRRP
jgi:hypothetical protein